MDKSGTYTPTLWEEVDKAIKYNGKYYDTGSKLGYLIANIEYGLKNKEIQDELKEYLKNIKL